MWGGGRYLDAEGEFVGVERGVQVLTEEDAVADVVDYVFTGEDRVHVEDMHAIVDELRVLVKSRGEHWRTNPT